MCEVIELIPERDRATAREETGTVALMRQPVGRPVSQCVRLGVVVCSLLEDLRIHGRLTET